MENTMMDVDISNVWGQISLPDLLAVEKEISGAHSLLTDESGCLRQLPVPAELPETEQIVSAAERIRSSEVCVVLGSSDACAAARGLLELLQGPERNLITGTGDPRILFAGNSLSTRQWNELTSLLEGKDFSVLALFTGKSDLEPAIAFRGLRWLMERRYGTDEARERIFVAAEPEAEGLQELARQQGWTCFGGRGSGASVPGAGCMLVLAAAGLDIAALLQGFRAAEQEYNLRSFENPAWLYAGVRSALYRQGRNVELLVSSEPGFRAMGHWWQRLAGESVFSEVVPFSADPAAFGRLLREGEENHFVTMLRFRGAEKPCVIGSDWKDLDGLGYLEGKNLDAAQAAAWDAAVETLADREVPLITVECGALCEETLGELLYFLTLACGLTACDLAREPLGAADGYEETLFRLLGKPEQER